MAAGAWELRTAGTATGGGYYADTDSGTDYSQQAAPELTLTDIVADGTATLTSVTGGFTAQMIDNGIYLSNISQWRQITGHTDTNTITVDANVTGGTGITGNVGGAVSNLSTMLLHTSIQAGHTVWIKDDGDYIMPGSLGSVAKDGSLATGWIELRGYKTTRGDNPTGTDMPKLDWGASYVYTADDRWKHKNIHMDFGGTASAFRFDVSSTVENCYIELTTSGAAPRALYNGSGTGAVIGCEVSAVSASTGSSNAIDQGGATPTVYDGNYIHDYDSSGYAIDLITAIRPVAAFNIIDTCTNGIQASTVAGDYGAIINNTIYNCTVGINLDSGDTIIKNNVIDSCTTGINNSGGDTYIDIDFNNYNNNTADVAGFSLDEKNDPSRTTNDPEFTDAPNGDFSNTLSAGDAMPIGGFTSNIRQGAVQQSSAAQTAYSSVT